MISRPTHNFWRAFGRLSEIEQQAAARAYELFAVDPGHPSLRFKKLQGLNGQWSVRVTLDVRAVGRRDGDTNYWNWIGRHADFDHTFA